MFWLGRVISKQLAMTLSLFLIGTLHTLIIAIFQIPENFLLGRHSPELTIICKIILYTCAIITSLSHQFLCRKIGLRKTLYLGLLCNLLGITTLMMNELLGEEGLIALIFLDMLFFGIALASVINSLVTYTIIEFPKKVGFGIVALFAFLNVGNMIAPLLLDVFRGLRIDLFLYPFLIALLWISLWFVHIYFIDPSTPAHMAQLRKGTLVWKELHYRLGLFVVAIVAYALAETTFDLWGFIQIENQLGLPIANETIPIFWLFMVVGQVLLLVPLYFFPAMRIFFILILFVIGAAFYFPLQTTVGGFIAALVIAGIGCSAIFPILLSIMEKEMLPFARGNHLLHFIEVGISVMLAGYFLGVGSIDLWVQILGTHPFFSLPTHFHMAALFIGVTGIVGLFLSLTTKKCK